MTLTYILLATVWIYTVVYPIWPTLTTAIRHASLVMLVASLLFLLAQGIVFRLSWQRHRAEIALEKERQARLRQEAETRYGHLLAQSQEVMLLTDENMIIVEANERAGEVYGIAHCKLIGTPVRDLRAESSLPQYEAHRQATLATGSQQFESTHRRADGSTFPVRVNVRALQFEGKRYFHAVIRDVTLEHVTREQARLVAGVQQESGEGIVHLGPTGEVRHANPAFERMTGFSLAELQGVSLPDVLGVVDRPRLLEALQNVLARQESWQQEIRCSRKDGMPLTVRLTVVDVSVGPDWPPQLLGLVADISEQRARERMLEQLKDRDPLTGLPSWAWMSRRGPVLLRMAEDSVGLAAALVLDIDDFKKANTALGRALGDVLLCQVADRLREAAGQDGVLCRRGGDEFEILITQLALLPDVERVARRVLDAFARPFVLEGHPVMLSTSVGLAFFPMDSQNFEELFRQAEEAMYQAKEQGKNCFLLWRKGMSPASRQELRREVELGQALERSEFRLHYQPQLDLITGTCVGVEALLRWQHPEEGLLYPAAFIELMERSQLISAVGESTLREACRQAELWRRRGWPLRMAVNISPKQFTQGNLAHIVRQALEKSGLPAHLLELELTERGVPQEAATEVAEELRQLGVTLAIDDFGTGNAGLGYLRRFPIRRLKIDRSFVASLGTHPEGEEMLRALLNLGHALGLQTLAEGVERDDQLATLRQAGCDEVQGYRFAYPMPAEDLENWLREQTAGPETPAPPAERSS